MATPNQTLTSIPHAGSAPISTDPTNPSIQSPVQQAKYTKLNYDSPPNTRYLPTTAAYDLWAEHYDHDGNFLQALDSLEMQSLFPRLVTLLKDRQQNKVPGGEAVTAQQLKLVDLGCGTGRNTVLLMDLHDDLLGVRMHPDVVAVDASEGMLGVARERIRDVVGRRRQVDGDIGQQQLVRFQVLDLLADESLPDLVRDADVVVSTLVLEHIPCDIFFDKVAEMLKPGGLLLLTNMHSHMGGISQAGFVDPKTGEKIRPTSYAHTVQEVQDQAKRCGLVPVDGIKEVAVDETLVDRLGPRSRKWVGVTCWFGGVFRK